MTAHIDTIRAACAEAKRLREAATPRDWTADLDSDHGDYVLWGPRSNSDFVTNMATPGATLEATPEQAQIAFDLAAENARFLEHARNTDPWALLGEACKALALTECTCDLEEGPHTDEREWCARNEALRTLARIAERVKGDARG